MNYKPRVVERELTATLAAAGAVLIEGPKGCGKTETARRHRRSEVLFDVDADARALAAVDPSLVLGGDVPRLLDEWQLAPEIWNAVRREVDRRQRDGQPAGHFLLTGSAHPTDDITKHTGAARIARLRMRPMSLLESGHSDGRVSLHALLTGTAPAAAVAPALTFADVVERITVGGWPGMQALTPAQGLIAMRSYATELARADVRQLVGRRASALKIERVLVALSRHVGTNVSSRTLAADVGGGEAKAESLRKTVERYLDALERLMITEDLPGWGPHLRARARTRTAPKRYFVDPALAVAYVGATPARLLTEMNYLGFLFESLVVRDLRIYAQANDATVAYYRDNTGLEIDTIVEQRAGAWAAFEIKLGGREHVEKAATDLLRFRDKLDPARTPPPAVLGVIVSQGPLLTRPDGVMVIPVGALAP